MNETRTLVFKIFRIFVVKIIIVTNESSTLNGKVIVPPTFAALKPATKNMREWKIGLHLKI